MNDIIYKDYPEAAKNRKSNEMTIYIPEQKAGYKNVEIHSKIKRETPEYRSIKKSLKRLRELCLVAMFNQNNQHLWKD